MAPKVVQPWSAARSCENELDRESVWVFGATVKGFEDLQIYQLAWSLDGKTLAYTRRQYAGNRSAAKREVNVVQTFVHARVFHSIQAKSVGVLVPLAALEYRL